MLRVGVWSLTGYLSSLIFVRSLLRVLLSSVLFILPTTLPGGQIYTDGAAEEDLCSAGSAQTHKRWYHRQHQGPWEEDADAHRDNGGTTSSTNGNRAESSGSHPAAAGSAAKWEHRGGWKVRGRYRAGMPPMCREILPSVAYVDLTAQMLQHCHVEQSTPLVIFNATAGWQLYDQLQKEALLSTHSQLDLLTSAIPYGSIFNVKAGR